MPNITEDEYKLWKGMTDALQHQIDYLENIFEQEQRDRERRRLEKKQSCCNRLLNWLMNRNLKDL